MNYNLLLRKDCIQMVRLRFYLVFFVLLAWGATVNAASLRSQWDVPVSQSSARAKTCPTGPKVSRNLTTQKYYESDSATINSSKRNAYLEDTKEARLAAQQVVQHADLFRATGDPEEAHCVAQLILVQAENNALGGAMKGNQAKLFRTWMLNAYATSWLKVRQDSALSSTAQDSIKKWLDGLAQDTIDFHKTFMPKIKDHNLRYWAGLAVMNTGVALNRQDFFDWGVQWAKNGINAIQADGTLKQELRRKARARKYHLFAIQPLIAMAEVAWVNGIDLYSLNDRGLQRLARMSLTSLSDPSLIENYTKIKQAKQSVQGTNLEWLAVLAKRFPDSFYDSFLEKYPTRPDLYLGGRLFFSAQ